MENRDTTEVKKKIWWKTFVVPANRVLGISKMFQKRSFVKVISWLKCYEKFGGHGEDFFAFQGISFLEVNEYLHD